MAHPKLAASPNEPKTADDEAHPAAAGGGGGGGGGGGDGGKDAPAAESPVKVVAFASPASAASAASPAAVCESPDSRLAAAVRSDHDDDDDAKETTTTAQKAATTTATAQAKEPPAPTYFSVRSSPAYSTARALLAAGRFEDALQLVEAAMVATRQSLSSSSDEEEGEHPPDELHPALAPLHYLYGTTLLYSVEESDDMVNGSGGAAGGGAGGAGEAGEDGTAEDLQIAWENLDLARTILDVRGLVGEDEVRLATATSANDADDPQGKAEAARTLLLDLAQIHLRLADLQRANGAHRDCLADYARALELRRAVLGPYDRRVADVHYQLGVVCMIRAAEGGGGGDRGDDGGMGGGGGGAAGAASASMAAAGASASASAGLLPPGAADGILGMMAAAASEAAAEAEAESRPTAEECRRLRERSVREYLACARSFGGCIAKLCGVDDDEQIEGMVGTGTLQDDEGVGTLLVGVDEGDRKMPADTATTAVEGKKKKEKEMGNKVDTNDEQEGKQHGEHQTYTDASRTLAGIRARCAELANARKTAASSGSATTTEEEEHDMEVVADLLSLLDELQETIDSQEEDLRGVHEVQEMKTRIEEEVKAADADPFGTRTSASTSSAAAAAAGATGGVGVGADGSVTTIGFGQPTTATTTTTGAVAAGASSAGTGEPARPMMVVKKKKKKRAALAPADGSGAAPAAEAAKPAQPDAKRAKTE